MASRAMCFSNPGAVGARQGERGQATALLALFLCLLLFGFLGFALDVGNYFREKRMAQAAADAAALAAAEEQSYGNTTAQQQAAANAAATLNGFSTSQATNPATVTLTAPTSGVYSSASTSSTPTYVQATVTQAIPGTFFNAFRAGSGSLNIAATAIAGTGGGTTSGCVCLEGTAGQTLNVSNGSKIMASTCGIVVDSTSSNAVGITNGSSLAAVELGVVSTSWTAAAGANGGSIASGTKVVTSYSPACAPALPAAPTYSTCSADPINSVSGGGVSYTVGPGSSYGTTYNNSTVCYNGLTLGANGDTVTLNAGIYVINGGSLHFASGGNKGGAGVMFYLINGAKVTVDNGANIALSAPTSGTYDGILIYQAASDTQSLSIQGGSSSTMSGALFAPGAAISLGGGSGASVTASVLAQSLTLSGGGTLTATAHPSLGSVGQGYPRLTQ